MINVKETGKPASDFVKYLLAKGFMVRDFSKKAGLEPDTHFRISVGLQEQMGKLIAELRAFN